MTAEVKPYPVNRDSCVPWLGEIPEHWGTRRAKRLFRKMERPVRAEDDVVTCFRDGVVTLRKNRRSTGFTESLKEIGYQGIRKGDLVIHAMDAFAGAVGVADSDGKGTPVYSVCTPVATADARYYAYVVREMARSQWIEALAKGIRERSSDFRFEAFGSQELPLPSVEEQAAIVRFLNHADRRIRRYIRAKQKLVKLLEEQKRAIIHRAVTCGLDPDVRLKPSGVEWLRDVPRHWEVTRLKFVATQIVDCLHATPIYSDNGDYPAIRTADVFPGELRLGSARRVDDEHYQQWTSRMAPREGDILYTREGERFGIAALVPAGVRLCISQRMMAFRIRPAHNPAYIMWQINCRHVYSQAAADVIGAAAPHVNIARIRNFALVLPPREEQDAIVSTIEEATRQPEAAIRRAREEVALLREFRTRLIADVVTGKLDVRETAAQLPDEPEEVEPSDEADDLAEPEEESEDDLEAVLEEAEA